MELQVPAHSSCELTGVWIPHTGKSRRENPVLGMMEPLCPPCHDRGKCTDTPALLLPWAGLGTFFKLSLKGILNNF